MAKQENIFNKVKSLVTKDLSLIRVLDLFNICIKMKNEDNIENIKLFIKEYYFLEEDMPDDFYELLLNRLIGDDVWSLVKIFIDRNIYLLISYLKYNGENVTNLKEFLTPLQYYIIPKKYINRIIKMLKELEVVSEDTDLSLLLKDEWIWKLKKSPCFSEMEYKFVAYKMYISIGWNNSLEFLSKRYGEIDYEKVYFLFSKLLTMKKMDTNEEQIFNNFLFDNKKDFNNVIRQMLSGNFKELFLNFDYFYNNFRYFVSKLGTKMSKDKVKLLLEERYLTQNVLVPEITADILEDMVSSYYCKYEVLNTPEQDIYKKNFAVYDDFLRQKYKSSIPMIEPINSEMFFAEVISLSDPRNLVLGYRAGNCFRINGEAAVLFRNFLQSDHMRLLSISTLENKDFAMMLIMRNGNVLIGQGIEISKWAPLSIQGKKLYNICREVLKEMMDYMNSVGDEIVATIIGRSNANVSDYNNQVLPFLIKPILENYNNYYNGIDNYQCLLDITKGKSLQDIKLYEPTMRYFDRRSPILRRTCNMRNLDDDYMEVEKRLISLRFLRVQNTMGFEFYQNLLKHKELYSCCNRDWYITLFDDGTIDSFILTNDERAKAEYDSELEKIQQDVLKNIRKTISLNCKRKTIDGIFSKN